MFVLFSWDHSWDHSQRWINSKRDDFVFTENVVCNVCHSH